MTNRGDCIGLPEATLHHAGDTVLALVVLMGIFESGSVSDLVKFEVRAL
ncbi:hypothetical protein [Streptomyces collinus]